MRQGSTPFVGREAELARLGPLLDKEGLLTLTGAGGNGKSRLASEAARRADGVEETFFVEFAGVASEELVAATVLDRIGAREEPGRSALEAIVARLSGRPVRLVADNCEHLVEGIGRLVAELLERCPDLRVLATSRQPLGLDREHVWQVPAMSVPGPDSEAALAAVVESDAGRLFVVLAAHHASGFGLTPENAPHVAQICRGLDGIPLAISLAAARVAEAGLEEISAGLADRHGLRASLDWSYGLLDSEEQLLFRCLAVLIGASGSDAVAVCDPSSSPEALAARLERLAALGLIEATSDAVLREPRYEMLETVRDYAHERLVEEGEEEEARRRHLERFAELSSAANELLNSPRGRRTLDTQAANLQVALARAVEWDAPTALAMCERLTYYWFAADRYEEGRLMCARALAAAPGADPAPRALALRCQALLAAAVEDYTEAYVLATEALGLAESSGDERTLGLCLQAVNLVLGPVDPSGAAKTGRRARELLRELGGDHDLGHALLTLAVAEALRDRFESFDALRAEFMSIPSARDDEWLRVFMDLHSSWAHLIQGEPRSARADAEAVLERIGSEVSTRAALARAHRLHAMAWEGEASASLEEGLTDIDAARAAGSEVGALTLELAVAAAELALGDFDSVSRRAEASLGAPAQHAVVFWREALARIALEEEDTMRAGEHAAVIREVGERTGSPRQTALADYLDGAAALQDKELERAATLLHAALAEQAENECRRDAADTLEALGLLAARSGDALRGSRLLAASAAARRSLGCVRVPPEGKASIERRAEVDVEQVSRARAEGARLPLQEAISYAQRARGKRERAVRGWASLTPVETQVAELAATGLSNPAIATRLLMSRSTVKAHLSSVYRKLGVANRTELAAASVDPASREI
jgi:predicted ATPase/DNA-binding NarL/FixJ family response regulator